MAKYTKVQLILFFIFIMQYKKGFYKPNFKPIINDLV